MSKVKLDKSMRIWIKEQREWIKERKLTLKENKLRQANAKRLVKIYQDMNDVLERENELNIEQIKHAEDQIKKALRGE